MGRRRRPPGRRCWPTVGNLDLDPGDAVAYLCGNPGMISGIRSLLLAKGLPPEAIRAEEFWTGPATDTARS